MTSPFDFANEITFGKKDLLRNSENDELMQKEFGKGRFIILRALSNHIDCILYANEMNLHRGLDARPTNDYLRLSIRKQKRFGWAKREGEENVEMLMKALQVNRQRALEYMRILSDDQLSQLRDSLNEGGKKGK